MESIFSNLEISSKFEKSGVKWSVGLRNRKSVETTFGSSYPDFKKSRVREIVISRNDSSVMRRYTTPTYSPIQYFVQLLLIKILALCTTWSFYNKSENTQLPKQPKYNGSFLLLKSAVYTAGTLTYHHSMHAQEFDFLVLFDNTRNREPCIVKRLKKSGRFFQAPPLSRKISWKVISLITPTKM